MADDAGTGDDARSAMAELTKAVQALSAIAERLGTSQPPAPRPPTEATREARDTVLRYRLLRAVMTGEASALVARVQRHEGGLKVGLPAGVAATHLSLVGDRLSADPAARTPAELPIRGDRISAQALRGAHIDVTSLLDDLRLLEGPGGPVVAVAPALAPAPANPVP